MRTYEELRLELMCAAGASPPVRAIVMLLDALEELFREDFDPLKALEGLEYWIKYSKAYLNEEEAGEYSDAS